MNPNFYHRVWKPLKKLANILLKRGDDDDNYFDHPYAIF